MSAAELVARGAALLDEKRPGWAAEIDLTVLDLSNSCRCVLGQIYTPASPLETSGFIAGLDLLGLDGDEDVEHGFNVEPAPGETLASLWAELDELWIAEIRRRTETPAGAQ